jgi:uncharacterized membrane-anchored protein YitT (DUF2179 family)
MLHNSQVSAEQRSGAPHSVGEDVHAILLGSSFAAFGLVLLKGAGISTGSLAGVAILSSFITGWSVGAIYVLLNIPFLLLSLRHLGWIFTAKSLGTMLALAGFSEILPRWISIGPISPLFAAIFGGSLIGVSVLLLARHRASLGGMGILALYLQESRNISAGLTLLIVDIIVVSSSAFVLGAERFAYSAISVIALNFVMVAYHRPGRYLGY